MLHFETFKMRWLKSKLTMIIAGVVLFILALPFLLPSFIYRDLIESYLEDSTGLDVSFEGNFSFSLLPSITIDAQNVIFSGEKNKAVEVVGSIENVTLDVRLIPFLLGDIHADHIRLTAPRVTVTGDFTSFIPNWVRQRLATSRKEDIRYMELLRHFVENSVFDSVQVEDGNFSWNRENIRPIVAQKFSIDIAKPREGKDFTVNGNVFINDRSVDLHMRLQRPDDFLRGYRSKLTFKVDAAPARIEFNGSAAHRQTFVAQGNLRIDVPSLYEYCLWLGTQTQCSDQAGNLLIKSGLKLRDQKLQIENASYSRNPFSYTANGSIDFKGALPKITGTVSVPLSGYEIYHPMWKEVQKINFDDLLLDAFEANINLETKGIRINPQKLISPRAKLLLADGKLSLSLDNLKIFNGLLNARLRWYKGIENGYMDVRLDGHSLDIEQLQKDLGIKPDIKGGLQMSMEVQSEGSSMIALIETARINGEFALLDGTVLNPDIARSLSLGPVDHLDFAEIKGRIQGNRGQILSEQIRFVAPNVDISGTARLDILSDNLLVEFQSQKANGETEEEKGFIRINGPLNDLSLTTSASGATSMKKQMSDIGVSGMIPYSDEGGDEPSLSNENFVIEETDLLD